MISKMQLLFVEKLDYTQRNLYRATFRCDSPEDLKAVVAMVEDKSAAGSQFDFQGFDAQRHNIAMSVINDGRPEVHIVPTMRLTLSAKEDLHPAEVASFILDLIM